MCPHASPSPSSPRVQFAFPTSIEKLLFAYFCSHSQFIKASLSSGPFFPWCRCHCQELGATVPLSLGHELIIRLEMKCGALQDAACHWVCFCFCLILGPASHYPKAVAQLPGAAVTCAFCPLFCPLSPGCVGPWPTRRASEQPMRTGVLILGGSLSESFLCTGEGSKYIQRSFPSCPNHLYSLLAFFIFFWSCWSCPGC